jgi:hypothetical protein
MDNSGPKTGDYYMGDPVVAFLLAVALMFAGIAITPILGGKRGQAAATLFAIFFVIFALNWSSLKDGISASFHASLVSAASNAYVWLAMLGFVWIYLASYSLIGKPRIANPTPMGLLLEEAESKGSLPDPISPEDREHLISAITPTSTIEYKAQILYGPTEECALWAKNLGEILLEAKWKLVSPPAPFAMGIKVPRGISMRASLGGVSYYSRVTIKTALSEIGIASEKEDTAELRRYDYCIIYVNE